MGSSHVGIASARPWGTRRSAGSGSGAGGRKAGDDRAVERRHVLRRGKRVAVFHQQPVLRLGSSHQRKRAFQLFAAQEKGDLARVQRRADLGLGLRAVGRPRAVVALVQRIDATVPHDDFARAVLAGRNRALERRVIEGVILDLHREALDGGVERRAFRDRPRLQHAVEFEAEVVMHAPRGVLLHHEQQRAGARGDFGRGFRGGGKGALVGVCLKPGRRGR
jgi:hypothetical protein